MNEWVPRIEAVATAVPSHEITQEDSMKLARLFFQDAFPDIDRLLHVFAHSHIQKRYFSMPMDWFLEDRPFAEKNQLYIEHAEALAEEAARKCLTKAGVEPSSIDCLMFVSSTGIATPSLDSRLLHRLGLRSQATRVPLWGLGCAGGAMGLSRACEYTQAYPSRRVLLVSVELCGLTFIRQDLSKSNLVATCLFGDGAAAVLIEGDQVSSSSDTPKVQFCDARTTTWPDTVDIMGWELTDPGLKVIFSRDIPTLIRSSMRENVESFLSPHGMSIDHLRHFIFHPGGAKVLTAYQRSLGIDTEATRFSEDVLTNFGNMSSPTVLFVLEKSMEKAWEPGDRGLVAALGPGFSSELLLLEAR
ncbi:MULTISPECIES: type III polyketide synthase [Brevibacillus]|uniref:type III polyketide synthase n=1 Tax=Brevibacillus TaxID=55080 RepID=UPI00156A7B35|nr:3-oxoacyl-[acyl-carrier-protein] synthase III C-terminal domain-containing protein [Brevibacillus sp. HB2.2]NRS48073.1 type III polyketide synthase [Brevibacillus sp. HB2.2]